MDARRLTLAILSANLTILLPIELTVSQKTLANSIAQPSTAFSEAKTSKQENAGTPERGKNFSSNLSPSTQTFTTFSLKDDLFFSPPAFLAQIAPEDTPNPTTTQPAPEILPEETPNPTTTQTTPDSLANILGQIILQELPNLVETISPTFRSQVIPNPSTTEPETDSQVNIIAELIVQQISLLSDVYFANIDLQASSQTETELQANIVSELFVQQIPLLTDVYFANIDLQASSQTEIETPPAPQPQPSPQPSPTIVTPPPAAAPPPVAIAAAPSPPPAPVAIAAASPPTAPVAIAALPTAPVAIAAPPPPAPAPVAIAAAPPPPAPAPIAIATPPPPAPAPVVVAQQPPPPPPPAPKPVTPPKPQTQQPIISSANIQEKPVSANPIWWIPLAIIAALTAVVLFLLERQTSRRRTMASTGTPNVEFVAISDAGKQTIPSNQSLSMNFNIGIAIRLDSGRQTLKCDRALVSGSPTRGNL